MDVILGHNRQVQIDDRRQIIDIQTTSRHVGGNQNLHFIALEPIQRTLASGLRLVAVNAISVQTQPLQTVHQLINANPGLGEHQHLAPAMLFHQVDEQISLALLVHGHNPLLDR
ncbi:hypothetical protein ALQ26_03237 [Pseudomonas amygdali pv. lachrymans]|nr:hypothetical protein ALQ26_03237 [Pseudomonas amygdali pv. lachrymans]